MVKHQTNVMIKIVSILFVVVVGLVLVSTRKGVNTVRQDNAATLPEVKGITLAEESDNANETLRTVVRNQEEMERVNDDLARKNAEQQQRIDELLRMEQNISRKVETQYHEKMAQLTEEVQAAKQESRSLLNQLNDRLQSLKEAHANNVNPQRAANTDQPTANIDTVLAGDDEHELPIGLGIEPGDMPSQLVGIKPNARRATKSNEEYIWVLPDDMPIADRDGNFKFPEKVEDEFSLSDEPELSLDQVLSGQDKEAEKPIPVYTIPENATLIGSVGMTSLIGKVPVGGAVNDPFPFKAIVGAENLAANGIYIPGISTMILRGMATGEWTLSCVRGKVSSATFVFRDGTIRTVSGDLGWISDGKGVPCVTGERITNAVSFLSQRVGLAAASVYAQARAEGATQRTQNDIGGVVSQVIDPSTYAENTAIAEGLKETGDWLQERQSSSFDVIYVAPGAELVFHIDTEIAIDYDPKGRKVFHAENYNKVNYEHLD